MQTNSLLILMCLIAVAATVQASEAESPLGHTSALFDGKSLDGWTIEMDPVYTTPGTGLGAQVRVTEMGDSSHCREEPSSLSTEAQTMQAGTQAVVVGGPYQAEYWIWWQYELPNGHRCWIVDIPGWFEVTAPRTP